MPRVLGLWTDPIFEGRRIHERYDWTDPAAQLVTDLERLNSVIPAAQRYTLTLREAPLPAMTKTVFNEQHLERVDGVPYRLSPAEWVARWEEYGFAPDAWPNGGDMAIRTFVAEHDLIGQINRGEVDEVWYGGLPIPAAFEGAMLAPEGDTGAYRCHDRVFYCPGLRRRAVLHWPQIANWNLLHNYWHRIEAVMGAIWNGYGYGYAEQWSSPRDLANVRSYWQLFTLTHNEHPGEAQVGSCHFAPNSKLGYVFDMADEVPSGARLWRDFPHGFPLDLARTDRYDLVSAADWRGEPDYLWQFRHIPRAAGIFDGRYANWWHYVVDVNESFGRGTVTSRPWTSAAPQILPNVVTRYGDRALMSWQARPGDPPDTVYRLSVDGVDAGSLRRRGDSHTHLTKGVPLGRSYRLDADYPNGWTSTWDQNVPTPDPPKPPGGIMLTVADVDRILTSLHTRVLAGCPKPDVIRDDGPNVRLEWSNILGSFGFPVALAVNKTWDEAVVRAWYGISLPPEVRARCGQTPPAPPPPDPVEPGPVPPSPTPTVSLRVLFDAQISSLEAQLAVWREARERL